ncbi:MAG: hypothetical protein WBC70_16485 [Candidatus Aminicenantales bacterium]
MHDPVARSIFRAKDKRRRALARLPFEEKIRIVVRLQDIAASIRKNRRRRVWRLD